MLYFPRPAGDPGRPPRRAWVVPLALHTLGYNADALIGVVAADLGRKPLGIDWDADIGSAIGGYLISGILWWYVFAEVRPLSVRWEHATQIRRTSYGLVVGVGAVAGAVMVGLVLASAFLPSVALRSIAMGSVAILGPLIGIWWIIALGLRSIDPDAASYDNLGHPMEPARILELANLTETEAFGRRLGGLLFPNAVVALVGPLGAGKTHLSRAIAEGLGIANPAAVTSPTFTLVHEYPARLPIFHFDAYRLNGPDEFLDLGATEYYEAAGVCLIEWADKVEAALPAERLTIGLVRVDENRRRAEVVGVGKRYEALARSLSPEGAPDNSPGR